MSRRQDNKTETRRLPGNWIRIPVSAIQELTPSEYALWSVLQALCIANDHCWPTVETIGNYLALGYTRTWCLLQSLKVKGWLTSEKRGRQVNYSPVTPSGPIQKSEVIDSGSLHKSEEIAPKSIQKSEAIEPDLFTKVNITSSQKRRATLHKSEDRIIRKNQKKESEERIRRKNQKNYYRLRR